MNLFKFYLVAMMAILSLAAQAGVNLKNGNFYISYTDIVVPGGKKLEVTRTYNSKSTDVGWFGIGWGSDFETHLKVSADGSVVVHENGSGATTRFTPKSTIDPTSGAQKIVEAIRKKSSLTDKAAQDLVARLVKDAELRHSYATRYGVGANLSDGTVLYSNERGMQALHKLKDGYKRVSSDGKEEFFNLDGKLTKIAEKNGYNVNLSYTKAGQLEAIKDSEAKQLFFAWHADGLIKNVWGPGDKKAEYKFKGKDLSESKDVDGNTYVYTYDSNHNLNNIKFDKSEMKITYDSKTQFVTSVLDRNGEMTKYEYGSNSQNPQMHYWTTVTKIVPNEKPVSNRYEYEIKTKPDGQQYTYRILTEIAGIKTETIYSECCSLPVKITRGKDVTNFEYNADGLLTKKSSTTGEFVNIEYDGKLKKISRVVNNEGWTNFQYDDKGNLEKAVNSFGKAVLLIYDRNTRITKMVDHDQKSNDKRTLTFTYNAQGKPVEITMDNVGKINVAYDDFGEIKKVDSKAGYKMAMQVTQAFQNLLTIVRPAGVNLNM